MLLVLAPDSSATYTGKDAQVKVCAAVSVADILKSVKFEISAGGSPTTANTHTVNMKTSGAALNDANIGGTPVPEANLAVFGITLTPPTGDVKTICVKLAYNVELFGKKQKLKLTTTTTYEPSGGSDTVETSDAYLQVRCTNRT